MVYPEDYKMKVLDYGKMVYNLPQNVKKICIVSKKLKDYSILNMSNLHFSINNGSNYIFTLSMKKKHILHTN